MRLKRVQTGWAWVLGAVFLSSAASYILIPYAGHLAPAAIRGRVVGNVTSGLMIGVMLARPAARTRARSGPCPQRPPSRARH